MALNPCLIFALLFSSAVALDNGLGLTPPMGWTTWCTDTGIIPCYDDYCSQAEIESVARAMASNGMKELGYEYINLDDCWAGPRDAQGNITAEKSRFPSGTLKPLADYVHSLGLKLGMYTDVGEHTCRDNRPGSWPHYQQDANTYKEWGIDFVKMDWCDHPGGHSAEELYGMMRDALNETGRPMFFALCEWGLYDVWTWGMKTGNSWRVGPDHLPLWWTPETSQDPGQGQGTANIIEHMAGLSKYAGPGGWNDPDFLMTGMEMIPLFWLSETDWQTEFSFWCLFSAPLVVASDIRDMSNKQVLLNKEAIAVNQDPLGIPGDRRYKHEGGEIWTKPLSGGAWAVIFYCSNDILSIDLTMNIDSKTLPGWPKNTTSASFRDIWDHRDVGVFQSTFSVKDLGPHATQMYIVKPR